MTIAPGRIALKESEMKTYQVRSFAYRCSCGYSTNVFVDCGVPQEAIRCRKCSREIRRND
jgi:predicted SprT family Zn-dependent metalloprotease